MLVHHAKVITWGRPNEIVYDQALNLSDGLNIDMGSSSDRVNTDLHPPYPQVICHGICYLAFTSR